MAERGRPTLYTPELADEICEAVASSELGLCHLVDKNPHWPHRANIFIWMRKYPDFRNKYTKAKEDQVEVSVEHMQEIMNEPHKYKDLETGLEKIDVPMLRLKMDAIRWQAGKLKRKKYGDEKQENPEEQIKPLHDEAIERTKVLPKEY
jgi:hypothetical protein